MSATEQFASIVEDLNASPWVKKKAAALGAFMFMLITTWLVCLPAFVWHVYTQVF